MALASKIVFLQVPGAFGTEFGFLSQCTGTAKAAHTNSTEGFKLLVPQDALGKSRLKQEVTPGKHYKPKH